MGAELHINSAPIACFAYIFSYCAVEMTLKASSLNNRGIENVADSTLEECPNDTSGGRDIVSMGDPPRVDVATTSQSSGGAMHHPAIERRPRCGHTAVQPHSTYFFGNWESMLIYRCLQYFKT